MSRTSLASKKSLKAGMQIAGRNYSISRNSKKPDGFFSSSNFASLNTQSKNSDEFSSSSNLAARDFSEFEEI